MGRYPKPKLLKIATGNAGRRPIRPMAGATLADPETPAPDHLSDEAKSLFREFCRQLCGDRLLAVIDVPVLAGYAEALGTIREMNRVIDREGATLEGPHGPVVNPAVKVRTDATRRAESAAKVLGIGALNRERVSPLPAPADANSLESFFQEFKEERFFTRDAEGASA